MGLVGLKLTKEVIENRQLNVPRRFTSSYSFGDVSFILVAYIHKEWTSFQNFQIKNKLKLVMSKRKTSSTLPKKVLHWWLGLHLKDVRHTYFNTIPDHGYASCELKVVLIDAFILKHLQGEQSCTRRDDRRNTACIILTKTKLQWNTTLKLEKRNEKILRLFQN